MSKGRAVCICPLEGVSISEQIGLPGFGLDNMCLLSDKSYLTQFRDECEKVPSPRPDASWLDRLIDSEGYPLYIAYENHFDSDEVVQTQAKNIESWLASSASGLTSVVTLFSVALWLTRDFHLTADRLYVLHFGPDDTPSVASIYRIGRTHYTASGGSPTSLFATGEISAACSIFSYVGNVAITRAQKAGTTQVERTNLSDLTRLERACHCVHAARGEWILSYKILHYVTCLECLVGRGTTEISHQISERTALLVGHTPPEKKEWYEKIRKAYRFRSAFVHGDEKSCTDAEMREMSQSCDQAVRKLLSFEEGKPKHAILFEEGRSDSVKKHFNDFFLDRMFLRDSADT